MIYRKFYTLTISFFGHRQIFNSEKVRNKLYNYLKQRLKDVIARVLVGTHGDFDRLAFGVCKQLKREGYNIDISLVYTSQKQLTKDMDLDKYLGEYKDIEVVMYEIENEHYKRQIIISNHKMVDQSDEVVVYYTGKPQWQLHNGTRRIVQYCKTKNRFVTNIYD